MKESAISWVTSGPYILGVWNPTARSWCMPGGKVEPGESPRAAQERELTEETGLTTLSAELIYSAPSTFVGPGDTERIVHVFAVRASGVPRRMEPLHPVCWLPPDWLEASDTLGPFFVKLFSVMKRRA